MYYRRLKLVIYTLNYTEGNNYPATRYSGGGNDHFKDREGDWRISLRWILGCEDGKRRELTQNLVQWQASFFGWFEPSGSTT
jgi:hypothetical protein